MAHEELKKQYDRDYAKYGMEAYKLWERRPILEKPKWKNLTNEPLWLTTVEYRRKETCCCMDEEDTCPACEKWRKETPFQPEYFSGLNWREAKKLVGEKVEFSDNPSAGWRKGRLSGVRDYASHFQKESGFCFEYIRTCPETYAHPTINIGGVELPMPETEAPEHGTNVYVFAPEIPKQYFSIVWYQDELNEHRLNSGLTHLTKDRAQAWADWWKNHVVKAIKGE